MGRRRAQRNYLTDEEGAMGVMHIPGHERQRPREVALEEIRALMGNCQLCPLGQTRTTLVFGVGNPRARVVFVGEGPGRNEDLQGEPFVGAAGQNLNALLALAGLRREDIYICNVIKCRPPGNRNPKPEEIAACSPFLREQIRSIWPDVIVCLGNFAAHFVLRTEAGITSLRGRFHQAGHFAVLPTFHPAAALYHREWQQFLDDDFRLLGQWLAEHPAGPTDGVPGAAAAAPTPAVVGAAAGSDEVPGSQAPTVAAASARAALSMPASQAAVAAGTPDETTVALGVRPQVAGAAGAGDVPLPPAAEAVPPVAAPSADGDAAAGSMPEAADRAASTRSAGFVFGAGTGAGPAAAMAGGRATAGPGDEQAGSQGSLL